jgi:hypothetical protein
MLCSLDNKKTVVNLSEVPLEEAACSALGKSLNFVVAQASCPFQRHPVAIGTMSEETAEEI